MTEEDKELVWLQTEIKTPPFSSEARLIAGYLLRQLQQGENLEMPDARPMPSIGRHCLELRVPDNPNQKNWRIICRIDEDAIVIVGVFPKKTQKTPKKEIDLAKKRLKEYDELINE